MADYRITLDVEADSDEEIDRIVHEIRSEHDEVVDHNWSAVD